MFPLFIQKILLKKLKKFEFEKSDKPPNLGVLLISRVIHFLLLDKLVIRTGIWTNKKNEV